MIEPARGEAGEPGEPGAGPYGGRGGEGGTGGSGPGGGTGGKGGTGGSSILEQLGRHMPPLERFFYFLGSTGGLVVFGAFAQNGWSL